MKMALGFMFQNEAAWINLHLPVLLKSAMVDGVVAIDGGSTDGGRQVIESLGGQVRDRVWDWKPCEQENAVIQFAEAEGYDALMLVAPDELWFPEHLDQIKMFLAGGQYKALRFPTYNFMKDRLHYSPVPPYYPDAHVRAWMLNEGVRHVGALDSVPNTDALGWYEGDKLLSVPHIHLYHYAHIKNRAWYTLKGLNFHRVKDGLSPLGELPEGTPLAAYPMTIPFVGVQPLDPSVGKRAPLPYFEETPAQTSNGAFMYKSFAVNHQETFTNWEWLPEIHTAIHLGSGIGEFGVGLKKKFPNAQLITVETVEPKGTDLIQLNLAHWPDVYCYEWKDESDRSGQGGAQLLETMLHRHLMPEVDLLYLDARPYYQAVFNNLPVEHQQRFKWIITSGVIAPATHEEVMRVNGMVYWRRKA